MDVLRIHYPKVTLSATEARLQTSLTVFHCKEQQGAFLERAATNGKPNKSASRMCTPMYATSYSEYVMEICL